jgi:hypothetical protein
LEIKLTQVRARFDQPTITERNRKDGRQYGLQEIRSTLSGGKKARAAGNDGDVLLRVHETRNKQTPNTNRQNSAYHVNRYPGRFLRPGTATAFWTARRTETPTTSS